MPLIVYGTMFFIVFSLTVSIIYLVRHGWSWWLVPILLLNAIGVTLIIGIDFGAGYM